MKLLLFIHRPSLLLIPEGGLAEHRILVIFSSLRSTWHIFIVELLARDGLSQFQFQDFISNTVMAMSGLVEHATAWPSTQVGEWSCGPVVTRGPAAQVDELGPGNKLQSPKHS